MCLLGIETCFTGVSVTLGKGPIFQTKESLLERGQSENLATLVRDILKESGDQPSDITDIYVNSGPGSFTGIRIGLSFVEGMAFSLPLLKKHYVSSFACALGNMIYKPLEKDTICVILKAIRETFYIQFFDSNLLSVSEPAYVEAKEASILISAMPSKLYGNFEGFFNEFEIIENKAKVNSKGAISCHNLPNLVSFINDPIYIRSAL